MIYSYLTLFISNKSAEHHQDQPPYFLVQLLYIFGLVWGEVRWVGLLYERYQRIHTLRVVEDCTPKPISMCRLVVKIKCYFKLVQNF